MPKASILLVEDEEGLGRTLRDYLQLQGHRCFWAASARSAGEMFREHSPEIVLMDIGLPDGNGFDLARSLRDARRNTSILFLSALNDPETRVRGLESGAVDYITKPFALRELLLRLRLLDRERRLPGGDAEHGPLKIWFSRMEVRDARGRVIHLGRRQMGILETLYRHRGRPVGREELISELWGEDRFPSNRTVDNHIVALRRWCETDPSRSIEIRSVRGVGYKLVVRD